MALRRTRGLWLWATWQGFRKRPALSMPDMFRPPRQCRRTGGRGGLGRGSFHGRPIEAKKLAVQLHQYNAERKELERHVLEEAIARVEESLQDAPVLLVDGEGWHPGVIGIVAARLKEKYKPPRLA